MTTPPEHPRAAPPADAEKLRRMGRQVIATEARAVAALAERIDGGFVAACRTMLA